MGSLYTIQDRQRYRPFTLMGDITFKNSIDMNFIQSFLDSSWPVNDTTGDTQHISKDGQAGDIAALTFVTENEDTTLTTETKLYVRNPAGVGSSVYIWTEYTHAE